MADTDPETPTAGNPDDVVYIRLAGSPAVGATTRQAFDAVWKARGYEQASAEDYRAHQASLVGLADVSPTTQEAMAAPPVKAPEPPAEQAAPAPVPAPESTPAPRSSKTTQEA
jgi:hypothetical protein